MSVTSSLDLENYLNTMRGDNSITKVDEYIEKYKNKYLLLKNKY